MLLAATNGIKTAKTCHRKDCHSFGFNPSFVAPNHWPRSLCGAILVVFGVSAPHSSVGAPGTSIDLELQARVNYAHRTGTRYSSISSNATCAEVAFILKFESFAIGAHLGGIIGDPGASEPTERLLLNPLVGAYFINDDPTEYSFRVGIGVALPAISTADPLSGGISEALVLETALAGDGGWNSWLYQPSAVSLVVPARLEANLVSGLVDGVAEAAIAALISTSGNANGTGVALQFAAEVHFKLIVEPGLRLQVVPLTNGGGQITAQPFFGIAAGFVHLEAAFSFNITRPFGPTFGDRSAWGTHLRMSIDL